MPRPTYEEMAEALAEAHKAIDTALRMVEEPHFIPSWDYLREKRQQLATLLTRINGEAP